MVLFDYFAAASPEDAAATIDWAGGPSAPTDDASDAYAVVDLEGVDPVVTMGRLEELVTGRSLMNEILHDPGHKPVAVRDRGARLVIPLGPRLEEALATASDEQLRPIVVEWAQTEEFRGMADVPALLEALRQLAHLAREANASGKQIYCWVCV